MRLENKTIFYVLAISNMLLYSKSMRRCIVISLIILIIGVAIILIVDISQTRRREAKACYEEELTIEFIRGMVQLLFMKGCSGSRTVADFVVNPARPGYTEILKKKVKNLMPWEFYIIADTEILPLIEYEHIKKQLSESEINLIKTVQEKKSQSIITEKRSDGAAFIFIGIPIGNTGKTLFTSLNLEHIFKLDIQEETYNKYVIGLYGSEGKELLIGSDIADESNGRKRWVKISGKTLYLKFEPEKTEFLICERVLTWIIGIAMTLLLISFLYQLTRKNIRLKESKTLLKQANEKLNMLAEKDSLTDLFNRRKFNEIIEFEIERAKRSGNLFGCIMMDIDHFKKINDTYGHQVGDRVLVEIAEFLKKNIRKIDTVARYGGEEFIILLHNASLEYSRKKAEVIRELLEKKQFKINERSYRVTSSFGVTCFTPHEYSKGEKKLKISREIINKADLAMYEAKKSGRNKVIVAAFNE